MAVQVEVPAPEEIKIKVVAAQLSPRVGVEVLPSLGLSVNPEAASCLGPGAEEIQPARGRDPGEIAQKSSWKTPTASPRLNRHRLRGSQQGEGG